MCQPAAHCGITGKPNGRCEPRHDRLRLLARTRAARFGASAGRLRPAAVGNDGFRWRDSTQPGAIDRRTTPTSAGWTTRPLEGWVHRPADRVLRRGFGPGIGTTTARAWPRSKPVWLAIPAFHYVIALSARATCPASDGFNGHRAADHLATLPTCTRRCRGLRAEVKRRILARHLPCFARLPTPTTCRRSAGRMADDDFPPAPFA